MQLLKFDRELLPSGNCIFSLPSLSTQSQAYTGPLGETAGMAEWEGFKEGFKEGFREGFKDGFNDGFKDGSNDGFKDGFDDGFKDGFNDGFKDGYKDGVKDGSKVPPCDGEFFSVELCSGYAAFTNHNRTAKLDNCPRHYSPILRGSNVYASGQHDIRIRLHIHDHHHERGIMIGVMNDPQPMQCYKPRLYAWSSCLQSFIDPNGDTQPNRDLGQPWMSGDIVHLHLDCERHTLRARHERTGKSQTIENVVDPQRLYITVGEKGTTVEIV